MPCQHLTQIKELKLPVSDAEALKVLCPICGQIEVCAYTPVTYDSEQDEDKQIVQGNMDGASSELPQSS